MRVKFIPIALCIIIIPLKTVFSQDCKFTWDNGTDILVEDSTFDIVLNEILDTEKPGRELISIQAISIENITAITGNSLSEELYVEPLLDETRLVLKLTDRFVDYEENEISDIVTITVTFRCLKGTTKKIVFIQPVEDTNNHEPEFLNVPYIYTLPMPFPKNIRLNNFQTITARDVDVTNSNISFSLDSNDPNVAGFSVTWLSKDINDRKLCRATLVTKDVINFIEDVTFALYATDTGNPERTSKTDVTIKVDRDNSILSFARPLYIANLTNLTPEEANGKVIKFAEGEIALGGGADKSVTFAIHDDFTDYEKNFELTVADDYSTIIIRLVDPPKKFFLESFVLLSLTAKKSASEETTVLHISLPGLANVSRNEEGAAAGSSDRKECDNIDYLVTVTILVILLLAATVGLVVSLLINRRTGRKLRGTVQSTVNDQRKQVLDEMEEIRNDSVGPNQSPRRSVAFNDNIREIKIAEL